MRSFARIPNKELNLYFVVVLLPTGYVYVCFNRRNTLYDIRRSYRPKPPVVHIDTDHKVHTTEVRIVGCGQLIGVLTNHAITR